MKTLRKRLLAVLALLLPLAAVAQDDETCILTLHWASTSSAGWSGNDLAANQASALKFSQEGILIQIVSPTEGYSGDVQITINRWQELTITWQSGDYDSDCSFSLTNANGAQLVSCASATYANGQTIFQSDDPCEGCFAPYALSIDSIGFDYVHLAWNGSDEGYEVELGPVGFTPGDGTLYILDTLGVRLEDLENGIMYEVFVYGICNDQRTEPARLIFTTPGAPIEDYPYTTGFEADDDRGWMFVQGNTNQWTIGEAAPMEGEYSLYISNDGGQTNAYSNIPTLSYAYRTFAIQDTSYLFQFAYRVAGDEYTDYLRAFLVPESETFTADAFPGSSTHPMTFRNSLPAGWIDLKSTSPRTFANQTTWTTYETTHQFTPSQFGNYNLLFLWVNYIGSPNPPAAAIDNVVVARNTCPAPTDFAIADLSATEALLGWNNGGEETMWQLSIDGNPWFDIYDNPYLLDDLTPGTGYRVRLRAACDDEDFSLNAELTFHTLCPDSLAIWPYIETFESYDIPTGSNHISGVPSCWQVGNTSVLSVDYPWLMSKNGNKYLNLTGSGISNYYSYAILPPLEGEIADMELSIDLARYSDTHNDTLIVGLMIGDSLHHGFDTVAVLEANTSYFVRHRIHFTDYSGKGKRIALIAPASYFNYAEYDNSGFNNNLFPNNEPLVDNVRLYPTPACYEPENLRCTFYASDLLTLAWDTPDDAESYTVRYRMAGDEDWTEDYTDDPLFDLADLAPSTTYEVEVLTYCANGDQSLSVEGSFRTLCDPIDDFPYAENFTTDDWASCWQTLDLDLDAITWMRNPTNNAIESTPTSSGTTDNWAIMPPVQVPEEADGFTLSYNIYARFYGEHSHYQLLLSDAGIDTADFATVLRDEDVAHASELRNVSLEDYAGQTIYLAFRHLEPNGHDLSLSSVQLRTAQMPTPVLNGPQRVSVGTTAQFTASLTEGSESGLYYDWFSTMEQHGFASLTSNELADTLYITYNTVGTDTLTLMAYNDFGQTGVVRYVSVIATEAASLPFTTGFEAGETEGWYLAGGLNSWHFGSATANGGSQALYISADGGTTATYDTATASVSFAQRQISIADEGARYNVSFDWINRGESDIENGIDYLRVLLIPDSVDLIPDLIPSGMEYTSDFSRHTPEGWIDLAGGPLTDSSTWQHLANTVSIPHAGTYNLTFLWLNDNEDGAQPAAAVDNFSLSLINCLAPTSLTATSQTTTSLTIGWTPASSEQQWVVSAEGNTQVVSTPSATIGGLQPGMYYDVEVRALCGEGDTSTAAYGRFCTDADCTSPLALPWTETFAGWNTEPTANYIQPCWNRFYVYNGGYESLDLVGDKRYVRADNYYSDNNLLMYSATASNIYFSLEFRSLAVLPEVALPTGTAGVSLELDTRFFAFSYDSQTGDTLEIDFLEVGYLPNASNPTTFVAIDTIHNHYGTSYITHTVDMPTYTPTAGRLALRYHFFGVADFNYVSIDRLSIVALNGPTGIQSAQARSLNLWPNPATQSVSISGLEPGSSVSILDLGGRVVRTLQASDATMQLDVSTMPRGIYFLRSVGSGSVATAKLVLE